ncbi:MAG: hypothetical protein ABR521_00175 [Gaiellaceae bacterium]
MLSTRLAAVAVAVLVLPATGARGWPLPAAPACPVFPADNAWNQRVDALPTAANSAEVINSIGAGIGLHADFGSGVWDGGPIGIPITVVDGQATPKYDVEFDYADESDPGPYPIPPDVAIEGGPSSSGDRHAIIVDREACRLYELYALYPRDGGWIAGSGAIWDLRSNALRPEGWTSADAAGLPILPGLARYDEVARGVIDHALRFTVERTRAAYVFPARHFASNLTDPNLPPMGLRLRLKASFDTSGFPPQARVVLTALKRYGMMVADNGSNWFISGAPDPAWDNDDLRRLRDVKGSAFEVVDTSSIGPGPTGLTVTRLSATRARFGIAVRWQTVSELGVLGYVVHRQAGSRFIAVSKVIVGKGTGRGGSYRFVDRPASVTSAHRYRLRILHADGRRSWSASAGVRAKRP